MQKHDQGYIVVETVGTFIPFLLLVISILSLVNIVTLQARVHKALTQAACTLSMYSYVLHTTGVTDKMDSVFEGIDSLSKGHGSDGDGDPMQLIQSIANFGVGHLQTIAAEQLARPLINRYLTNGDMSGDEYLRSVRVVNFAFGDSAIVDRNGNIKLTVNYEVEYTFGALRLPFGPTLRITQTAVTKAWLDGSGD